MSDETKGTPEDILALLAEVYGPSEAEARDQRVQRAVKHLEHTHRQAALAMRNFESLGTLRPDDKVVGKSEPADPPAAKPRGTQPTKKMQAALKHDERQAPEAKPPTSTPAPPLATPNSGTTKKPRRLPQRRQVAARQGRSMEMESGSSEVFFESPV